MYDPAYLLSVVVETIADASPPPVHHLLDAYATFVNRVRSHSHLLEASNTVPLSNDLVHALRRDIGLAHIDPFSTHSSSTRVHLDIGIDTKQHARDSSSLCHHALCALMTIFRFPALYAAFPEHHLSSLLGDVLDIALADQLPALNRAKTYSLSLWTLACHRLPLSVLDSRRDDLASALQQSLDPARRPGNIVLDALKAISHTMEHYPSAFLDLLSPLLPRVISNLSCDSLEHRVHASIALGKFAIALIHQTELSLTKWQSLSDHITSVLESYCYESQVAPGQTGFSSMVRAAFSAQPHAHHPHAPAWILAVLASLIVLSGPSLYGKPTVLQFILQSLALALTHERSIVRALHPHVWRCFVWTFSQILLASENVEPALISLASHVIRQEVSGGIGLALVTVLLSDQLRTNEHGDRLSQALLVIKAMLQTECKHTRREGFMFLQALAGDAQARQQILQNMYEFPASVLFDGAVVRAEWDSLPSTIHSIPKVSVPVHWPEETEISRHYETLLVIWKQIADKAEGKHSDSVLVDVWLSILLACSHQLECGKDTATTTEMLRYMATIIVEFLPSVASKDRQPDWGSWNVHDQLHSLTFIDQLWGAVRRAFVAVSLAEMAKLILTSVLKLCASLMTTAPSSFLRDAHDPTTSRLVIRNQRELWGVVATSLASSEPSLDWKDIVKFLAIPICTWVLSEPELEAWEALVQNAISVSEDPAMVIEHIISQCFEGKEVATWDSIVAVLGFLLTYTRELYPTDALLSTVDVCLTVCYGRARHSPETLPQSLKLLNLIRRVIVSSPGNVMHVLQALRSSLCLWIEDHTEVMSDDEFNSVAVSLYCEVLKALEPVPLSIQSLQDTENFLASAFSRIPTPAIAPFAFEKFWRATYHGQAQFSGNLPPKIKSCLSCFVAAYGGDLADGLSLTGSQSQSFSNDSQVHSPISHQHQDAGGFGFRVGPLSTSRNDGARTDMKATLREHPHALAGQDNTTFLIPSPGDSKPQSNALRQLQEYTSQIDASSVDGPERSLNSLRILLSRISPSNGVVPGSLSPEKNHLVISRASNQKRKRADSDDAPQKRSRTTRGTLRSMGKSESEPATRDVTPVDVLRMSSVPLKRRKVFDGVQVPTFRGISLRRTVEKVETTGNIRNTGQDASDCETFSPRGARERSRAPHSTLPSSVGSDEDDLDWENFRVDGASVVDVDRSLIGAYPSSLLQTRNAPHNPDDLSSESSRSTAMSQSENFPSAHPTSLRKAKTTSSRLDTLRDVYSCVTSGASQMPFPELMQATRLVHQISAVLTEQMDKQMRRHKCQTLDSHHDTSRP